MRLGAAIRVIAKSVVDPAHAAVSTAYDAV